MVKKEGSSALFTQIFIDRPVLAWVLNIVLVTLGLVGYYYLSVRQYPQVQYPVITLMTQYEGASPEVMEMQVTRPLEEALAGLEGLDLMTSQSMAEQSKLMLRFNERRSMDVAASDVRDKLSRLETLPKEATTPRITKADIDAGAVMSLALSSKNHDLVDLYDYTMRFLKSEVESVEGVAMVEAYGGAAYEIHIVLDPVKMASMGVSVAEVSEALKQQNFSKPAGRIGEKDQEFLVSIKAKVDKPGDFENLVLFEREGHVVRIQDIGYVKLNKEDQRFRIRYNGQDAILLDITAQSRANPIQISKLVRQKMHFMKDNLPCGMKIDVAFDHSTFIKESIDQVYKGIWEAVILVLIVIFIFLRSLRIAIIPLITIPISLIGSFFVVYLLGFSINIFTLLALVLAVGLVVDDAIVVLENIYRHLEKGMPAMQAARLGIKEIQFSVVGMTLTLAAVYAPIALAQGLVGKLFTEFALTLSAAVIISGFVALVLSPMMCSRLLLPIKSGKGAKAHVLNQGWVVHLENSFNAWWTKLDLWYVKWLEIALKKSTLLFFVALLLGVTSFLLVQYRLPKELLPREDQGVIKIQAQVPVGATLSYLDRHMKGIDELFSKNALVDGRLLMMQVGDDSFARAVLKPRRERPACQSFLPELRRVLRENISGIRPYAYCASRSLGGNSDRPFSVVVQTDKSYSELVRAVRRVRSIVDRHPGIQQSEWDLPQETKELVIRMNRDLAASSNVPLYTLANMLDMLISGRRVSSFEKDSRIYPVKVMMENWNKRSADDLKGLMVRGRKENQDVMVPLEDLVEVKERLTNPAISHYSRLRSVRIDAAIKSGYNLIKVYKDIAQETKLTLGKGFRLVPVGDLKRFFSEENVITFIFLLAFGFVFLVMAAQFESFRDPFIILVSVPLALAGGVFTLLVIPGLTVNAYSYIGLITLIGLITKHGILLVDFSNQAMEEEKDPIKGLVNACRLRLRPILMTTCAMVFGAVPLVFGTGAGVEVRRQVGWVILGGLSLGTLFTLFVIPASYVLFSKRFKRKMITFQE